MGNSEDGLSSIVPEKSILVTPIGEKRSEQKSPHCRNRDISVYTFVFSVELEAILLLPHVLHQIRLFRPKSNDDPGS